MGTLQLGQFQPTLQREWSTRQLVGLVNLSLLFNDSVLLHDTQLLDNPHILEAFRDRGNSPESSAIYRQIREGIAAGLIDVGIRDGMLIGPDQFMRCGALEGVAAAWIEQRMTGVGRVRDDLPFRADIARVARDLDWTIARGSKRPVEYSYMDVKTSFQNRIRNAANTPQSPVSVELGKLPYEFVTTYQAILARSWFSHTDLFHLVKDFEPARNLMMLQGFTDEAAYSSFFGIELSGSDSGDSRAGTSAEALFSAEQDDRTEITVERLLAEHAARVIECPSIDALALLEITDVMQLRALGADIRALSSSVHSGVVTDEVEDRILLAFDDYWRAICQHIKKRFPRSSQRPTRILLLLRRRVPRIANMFVRGTRFAHRVAPVAPAALGSSPLGNPAQPLLQLAEKRISLEFLLFSDGEGLRALKKTVPRKTWRAMIRNENKGLLEAQPKDEDGQ